MRAGREAHAATKAAIRAMSDLQAADLLRRAEGLVTDGRLPARKSAVRYLAVVEAETPKAAVMRLQGISRPTLRESVRAIEERRDRDPVFDSRLEQAARMLRCA